MVKTKVVNPKALGRPSGYANGMRAGPLLFIAGQIGSRVHGDGRHELVSEGFVTQFEKALENVLEVVRAAGGKPEDVAEMTVFVKDMAAYRHSRKDLGPAWQRHMGKHYPAMTLVEVSGLFEAGAVLEIRAVAAVG